MNLQSRIMGPDKLSERWSELERQFEQSKSVYDALRNEPYFRNKTVAIVNGSVLATAPLQGHSELLHVLRPLFPDGTVFIASVTGKQEYAVR
jgi:hypothetical protein